MNVLLDRRGRPRARARLGLERKPASDKTLLRARKRRHRRGCPVHPDRSGESRRRSSSSAGTNASSWSSSARKRRSSPVSATHSANRASAISGRRRRPPSSRARRASPRSLCRTANIPTAAYGRFVDRDGGQDLSRRASGCPSSSRPTGWPRARASSSRRLAQEAEAAVDACLSGAFGAAGAEVVIEEFLAGRGSELLRALRRRARRCRWRRRKITSASATATRAQIPAAWVPIRQRRS